ncbi:preQ(0) biosynthesis protein QueC [Archaeoglobus sulfaticallidus PM70-1]|uniref:7-cyano-7-deazaguanine synthase n=1 Tax=Archaeoglobus sulfaticallidus PM70-1 TaxID=387631 RepID=N0BDM1_9EURY|nr:7-cyano-7-deazaguanine synthase QueC [Archaeoglobus sulfaticallidus]AGK61734.1 preQ(0) biosynthesis protein QueC [Archaeoglobus sulfaticallidus PM70-1]
MHAVLIFSGGVDSTTLLYYLISKGYEVHALTFIYGQKHAREVDASKKIAKLLGIKHKVVDITSIHELISRGSLTGGEEVPKDFYTEETQKLTIVPNRNMILLAIAGGYAVKENIREVYYAAHKSDYSIYPDCRKEFVKVMDAALYLANLWTPVELKAPFVDIEKSEIVGLGLKLGVPYELTWSCYEGKERPCLSCGTCLERTEAFLMNNARDPLLTEKEWNEAVKIYEEKKNEV